MEADSCPGTEALADAAKRYPEGPKAHERIRLKETHGD